MYLSIFGIVLCASPSSCGGPRGRYTVEHGQEIDQWVALVLVVPSEASRDVFGL